MTTPRLTALLLGRPRFAWGGVPFEVPSARGAALVALASLWPLGVARADLSLWLWGPDRAKNLRQELYRLRGLPGAEAWLLAGERVRVDADTDVRRFEDLAARGRAEEAVAVWTGPLLAGLERVNTAAFEEWLDAERDRLGRLRDEAFRERHRRWCAEGRQTEAAAAAVDALARDPADVVALDARLDLACAAGRRDEARAALEDARRVGAAAVVAQWSAAVAALGAGGPASPARLPDATRQVLLLLALAPALTVAQLARALEADTLETARGVERATELGWLDAGGHLVDGARGRLLDAAPPAVLAALHARIAEVLPDERDAAAHLAAAGEPDEAARRLIRIARETGDDAAAARAHELARDPALAAVALALRADAARQHGGSAPCVEALEALARRTQVPVVLFEAATQRVVERLHRRDPVAARAAWGEARQLAEDHPIPDGAAAVAFLAGAIDLTSGAPAAAKPWFLQAADAVDPSVRVRGLNALGAACAQLGDLDGADRAHREGLALARAERLRPMALRMLNSLGANAHRRGDPEEALRRFREAVEVAGAVRDDALGRTALANLVTLLQELGRVGETRSLVGALLERVRASEDGRTHGLAYRARARIEQFAGRFDEATTWSERSAERYDAAGDPANAAASRFNAALQAWQAAPAPPGWARVEEALVALTSFGRRDLAGDAAWEAARVAPDAEGLGRVRDHAASPAREALLDQRAGLLRGDPTPHPVLEAAITAPGLERVQALGLQACTRGADREALLAEARRQVAAAGEGLLGSQLESLAVVVEAWCADPLRTPWF
jgi:tetratricopeptide (TPR) repeat protein